MVILRQAQFSDHTLIAKLHTENWRRYYRGILSDDYLDNKVEQDRIDTWHERLSSPQSNQHVIVATLDNDIIGFACLFLDDDPEFGSMLDNLHVSTQQQKNGAGKLLMKECVKKITDHADIKRLYLWAYETNTNARQVYEHLNGKCHEIVESVTEGGLIKRSCRYTWEDISCFID